MLSIELELNSNSIESIISSCSFDWTISKLIQNFIFVDPWPYCITILHNLEIGSLLILNLCIWKIIFVNSKWNKSVLTKAQILLNFISWFAGNAANW